MEYNQILRKLSEELGLSEDQIVNTYKCFWLFIKDKIQELPLKEDISEEEFLKLRTSFNLPSLGKLACTKTKFNKLKNQVKYFEKYVKS